MNFKIRGWTFTHWWVRPVVKIWFDIYHKSVTYSGSEHINWDKPIIFAASHQNAFTDALCLILPTRYTNDRFIYPLTRADAFGNSKAADWILTAFHMLPVYRPKDKVNLKQQNDAIFGHCYDILAENRNLLVHPEGNCFAIKKVRKFKKGLARIALGAEEDHNFNLGVQIIPVGINYRNITEARKGIHIRFGKSINVSDFKNKYKGHSASAISALTKEVERRVKSVTLDLSKVNNYKTCERLIKLAKSRNRYLAKSTSYTPMELAFEKEVVDTIRAYEDINSSEELEEATDRIYSLLDEHKLSPEYLLVKEYPMYRLALKFIAYLVLSPIAIYGWINNIIPWFIIDRIADSIGDKQFTNSARMAAGLAFFPLCYLIQTAVFYSFSINVLWSLLYLVSIPLAGIASLNIWERWKGWKQQFRLKILSGDVKDKLFDLIDSTLSMIRNQKTSEELSNTTET